MSVLDVLHHPWPHNGESLSVRVCKARVNCGTNLMENSSTSLKPFVARGWATNKRPLSNGVYIYNLRYVRLLMPMSLYPSHNGPNLKMCPTAS